MNRTLLLRRLAWLLVVASLSSCVPSPTRMPADAVAGYDGRHVTYADFEGWVRRSTGDETVDLPAAALSGIFEQFLDELLLEHWAVDLGLIDERGPVPGADAEVAIRRLLERFPPDPVTPEEIERHFREHAEDHRRPERVRLRQLLFESRAEADAAVAELESGTEFGELVARRFPDIGERAGWLGELAREDLPPELVEAVFATPPGSETEVLADATGFHVFFVDAVLPAQSVPLEEAADAIRAQLEAEARRSQVNRLAAQARERYNLVLAAERLPFAFNPSQPPPASADP